MSLSSGSQNPNGPNFNNVGGGSRQHDQRQHQNMRQNFDNDSEDLNRQFNSRPSERPQASDSWSRYESKGGFDSSNYRTGPPPSSSSTTSRTEEQMRTGQMGGVGIMGAASSSSTSMGGGFMGGREGSTGMGNGMMGLEGKSHFVHVMTRFQNWKRTNSCTKWHTSLCTQSDAISLFSNRVITCMSHFVHVMTRFQIQNRVILCTKCPYTY